MKLKDQRQHSNSYEGKKSKATLKFFWSLKMKGNTQILMKFKDQREHMKLKDQSQHSNSYEVKKLKVT